MLFDPRYGRKPAGIRTVTTGESPRESFYLLELTTVHPKERMYSREYLREKRVVSLRRLLAELESYLTCSRRKLSTQERKNYVQAVLCLRSVRPALYEKEVQGASSRYDDFQLVHINQTFFIHLNV